jgi:hypothetical protein
MRLDPTPERAFRRLARPRKRHYTFARRPGPFTMVLLRHGISAKSQDVELPGLFMRDDAKWRCRGRVWRGEASVFAPFVYRLGRHPFTVERAVRFR